MASETVSKSDALKTFAQAHKNELYDVVALLDAAAERIDAATPATTTAAKVTVDTMHNTLRLVQMASEKTKAVADLMLDES